LMLMGLVPFPVVVHPVFQEESQRLFRKTFKPHGAASDLVEYALHGAGRCTGYTYMLNIQMYRIYNRVFGSPCQVSALIPSIGLPGYVRRCRHGLYRPMHIFHKKTHWEMPKII